VSQDNTKGCKFRFTLDTISANCNYYVRLNSASADHLAADFATSDDEYFSNIFLPTNA